MIIVTFQIAVGLHFAMSLQCMTDAVQDCDDLGKTSLDWFQATTSYVLLLGMLVSHMGTEEDTVCHGK